MTRPQLTIDCPICGKRGRKRTGVHFDDEYRCKDCDFVWEPMEIEARWIGEMINKLHNKIDSFQDAFDKLPKYEDTGEAFAPGIDKYWYIKNGFAYSRTGLEYSYGLGHWYISHDHWQAKIKFYSTQEATGVSEKPKHNCGTTGRNLDDPPCPACEVERMIYEENQKKAQNEK